MVRYCGRRPSIYRRNGKGCQYPSFLPTRRAAVEFDCTWFLLRRRAWSGASFPAGSLSNMPSAAQPLPTAAADRLHAGPRFPPGKNERNFFYWCPASMSRLFTRSPPLEPWKESARKRGV